MGNAITQESRALWLMLRNDGGWWTASMLTHYWRPTFQLYEIEQLLEALHRAGFLACRDQRTDMVTYAVTSSCKPLPGTEPAAQARGEAA